MDSDKKIPPLPIPPQQVLSGRDNALPPISPPLPPNGTNQPIPPAQNQSPNQTIQPPPQNPQKSNSSKKIIFAVILLLIVIPLTLTGGGIALAYNNYEIFSPPEPVKNVFDTVLAVAPLPKTPRIVIGRTQLAMAEIKTATVENSFEFKTTDTSFPISNAKLTFKGPIDLKDQNTSKLDLNVAAEVKTEGLAMSAAGEIIEIDNALYFKATEIPGGVSPEIAKFKNQWFVIKLEEKDQAKPDMAAVRRIEDVLTKYAQNAQNYSTLAQENNTFKLAIKPTKDEINNFIYDIAVAAQPTDAKNLEKDLQKDKLREVTDKLENFQINLTIDSNTYRLTESSISTSVTIPNPTTSISKQLGTVNLAPSQNLKMDLSFTSKFSDYDKTIVITPPTGAVDFKQFMEPIVKSLPVPKASEIPTPGTNQNSNPTNPQSGQLKPNNNSNDQTDLENLLNNSSPVLGTKKIPLDLLLLNYIYQKI